MSKRKESKGAKGTKGTKESKWKPRESIRGITNSAISKLAHRAGIKITGETSYEKIREIIVEYLNEVVSKCVALSLNEGLKTLMERHLKGALEIMGTPSVAAINPTTGKTTYFGKCPSEKLGKASAFKPSTNAIRRIRNQQENSDCIATAHASFDGVLRDIAQSYEPDMHMEGSFVWMMQFVCETHITNILRDSNLIAIHRGVVTINNKDIDLAMKIRKNNI